MSRSTTAVRWAHWQERAGKYAAIAVVSATAVATTTFPVTPLQSKCLIALAPDMSQSYLSWNWLDISERVRWNAGININSGRRQEDELVDASQATFTADNVDGHLSRQNPMSPHFGALTAHNPVWIMNNSGTGFKDRYFGFTSELPKRWDRTATDSTIPIVCRGPLDHILRNQTTGSAIARTTKASNPVAYWPLEDASGSTQAASGIAQGSPLIGTGTLVFAAISDVVGSKPLPEMLGTTGKLTGSVSMVSTGKWTVQTVLSSTVATSLLEWTIAEWVAGGGKWALARTDTNLLLSRDGTLIDFVIFVNPADLNGKHIVQVTAEQSGTTLLYRITFDAIEKVSGSLLTTSVGVISQVTLIARTANAADIGGVGHFSIFNNIHDATTEVSGLTGFDGEQTHVRLRRICTEEEIPFFTQASESATLGPQPAGTTLEVFRDAEKADLGVIFEHKFGIGYETLSQRYRKPVALALDIASGHITDDLEPIDNTLNYYNQWTVNRTNGSFAVAQKDGGIPITESVFGGEDTLGVQTDTQLPDIASWLANRDSSEADRWPNVEFMLHKHPTLIEAWLAFVFGERVTVANIMNQAGITALDLLTEGYNEHWNSLQWTIRLNTSDASVYDVAVLDANSRVDSASSSLTANIDSTITSIDVTTTDPLDLWTTDSAEWTAAVMNIIIGGEVMRVTNITGATSPQTFTVVRSVNGIIKSHIANNLLNSKLSEVHIFPAARLAI